MHGCTHVGPSLSLVHLAVCVTLAEPVLGKLHRFPIGSRGRRKKLREVGLVTGICATCFTLRAVIVALAAFDEVSWHLSSVLTIERICVLDPSGSAGLLLN